MIKRDDRGIIVQHSKEDPAYGDGGDSAMRTGLMALSGSDIDRYNLFMFFKSKENLLVRHPAQVPWNNPKNFTRDQLTCYMAGASLQEPYITKSIYKACLKRGFRAQNTESDYEGTTKKFPDGADLLSPADILFLAVCTDVHFLGLLGLSIIGAPWFLLNLLYATKIKPYGEQNQILCQCLVFGKLATKLYTKLHPNYKKAISDYWGGWRDQPEIGQALIDKVERTI